MAADSNVTIFYVLIGALAVIGLWLIWSFVKRIVNAVLKWLTRERDPLRFDVTQVQVKTQKPKEPPSSPSEIEPPLQTRTPLQPQPSLDRQGLWHGLTEREKRIARLVMEGYTNQMIAVEL